MRSYFFSILLSIFIFSTNFLYANNVNFYPDDSPQDTILMSYTAKEIVIEAYRQTSNVATLPASVSLLSDKTIRDRNITSIKEATGLVPNLFMPDYGSKMTSPVYIRGIGSRINAPSVGLYVDGVPYFDRASFDFNMDDVERIEILRGPQGTLFGRNTMGGIINVFTKSPLKYKETNVRLTGGSHDNYGVNLSNYNQLSDKLGYSLAGSYNHSGGYFKNYFNRRKADPLDEVSGRMRLTWNIKDAWYAHLIASYEYSDQGGYPYGLYNDTTQIADKVNYNEPSFYRRNMSTNGLRIEHIGRDLRFTSQSSFQYFDGKQGLDQDFTSQDLYYVDFYQRQQMYAQEFSMKTLGNRKYEWVTGIFGFHQNYRTDNDVHTRFTNPQTHSMQEMHTPSTGVAVFHQSTINDLFIPNLSGTLGLRYDWEQIKLESKKSTRKASEDIVFGQVVKDKSHFSQLTPKASLQYSFTNDELVYFSVSKGYKVGGFNTTVENDADRVYKPEHSWSYEVGTKASCLDKLIYTDISLFYIRWDDQQISQNIPGGKGYMLRNAGKSESKGVEIAMHINPIHNLSLDISYGYTHAKFKQYVVNDSLNYNGKYLPMVPRNTFTFATDYTIPLTFIDKMVLHAQYTGVGSIFWKDDNIAKQKFYGTINGMISFQKKALSLELWAKNIGGEKYVTYFFTASNKNYAQNGRPFTCGANLNLKF